MRDACAFKEKVSTVDIKRIAAAYLPTYNSHLRLETGGQKHSHQLRSGELTTENKNRQCSRKWSLPTNFLLPIKRNIYRRCQHLSFHNTTMLPLQMPHVEQVGALFNQPPSRCKQDLEDNKNFRSTRNIGSLQRQGNS